MATTDELAAKAKEVLESGSAKAREVLSSNDKVNELIFSVKDSMESGRKKAKDFAESVKAGLDDNETAKGVMDNLVLLLDMFEDYINGAYTAIPKNSIVAGVVALMYWLNPFDLVPDFMPGVGLLDDAAVLAASIAFMGEDVKAYRAWKFSQSQDDENAVIAEGATA